MDILITVFLTSALLLAVYITLRFCICDKIKKRFLKRGMLKGKTITVYASCENIEYDLMCAEYIAKGTDARIDVIIPGGNDIEEAEYIASAYAKKYGNVRIVK